MRLFASHGKVARLLQWSIDLEVSSTQSPTTLFRSDSYGSRMLSMFTKNVGGSYLRSIPFAGYTTHNDDLFEWFDIF